MLKVILDSKNMSLYRLEKTSHISHATLNDLYHEKTNIENCSVSLLANLSSALNIDMKDLYSILSYKDLSLLFYDESFDLFKSNVCHELNRLKAVEFLKKHVTENSVEVYFKQNKRLEALYMLSMIDHLCEENKLPLIKEYDSIRSYKLNKLCVPKSVYLLLKSKSTKISQLIDESIDVFYSHNIMEAHLSDVR